MPPASAHELYLRFDADDLDRSGEVNLAFVEHLNKFRPQRARRLFTELFVPIWVNDPILQGGSIPIPGLIQKNDVAALWHQLCHTALAEAAHDAQVLIDHLATTMLVNDAIYTPDAISIFDQMRVTTVKALNHVLKNPAYTRKFLEDFNNNRKPDKNSSTYSRSNITPLDRTFLVFMRDFLMMRNICVSVLKIVPLPTSDQPDDIETEAQAIAEVNDSLYNQLDKSACHELQFLIPLIQLHTSRRYAAVSLYLHEQSGDIAQNDVVPRALVGHLAAACSTLTTTLENALNIDGRLPSATIRLSRKEQGTAEEAMNRIVQLLPAVTLGGVLEMQRLMPQVINPWQECTKFITMRLARSLAQRTTTAFLSRAQPTTDHQHLVWLIRLIWRWYHLNRRHEFDSLEFFLKWQIALLEDIKVALTKAIKSEPNETPGDRFDHILRLDEFANAVDLSIAPFLSVSNLYVVNIISHGITTMSPHDTAKLALVSGFLASCRQEVKKMRSWQSPELTDLIALAVSQGL
ncbi:MAG: hypothetical protein WCK65_04620 [Rhodospirillaceae bacterium]